MRLLITRPEADASRLMAALAERGHQAMLAPLLRVAFLPLGELDLTGLQAVIATSRNALCALKSQPLLAHVRRLPLFAVGSATAAEGRALGFAVVLTGAGTAAELVTHIVAVADPAAGVLLQLAGDAQARDLKGELEAHGFRITRRVVYRMHAAAALSADTVEELATGSVDGVILMSPRTAATYASLLHRHGLVGAARRLLHLCVSAATAERLAQLGAVPIAVAARPCLQEVLALIDAAATRLPPAG